MGVKKPPLAETEDGKTKDRRPELISAVALAHAIRASRSRSRSDEPGLRSPGRNTHRQDAGDTYRRDACVTGYSPHRTIATVSSVSRVTTALPGWGSRPSALATWNNGRCTDTDVTAWVCARVIGNSYIAS